MTMPRLFDKRNMMDALHHRWVKYVMGTALGIALAALIIFNALLLWVATGPRSLASLTPYIQSALSSANRNYTVKIGQTWLLWDGWRHPIDLRLRNVTVLTKEGRVFSSFPQISLGVDVLALPFGNFLPTSITIMHPVISLLQNDDRSISFGFRQETPPAAVRETQAVPFVAALTPLLTPDSLSGLRKLRYISIVDADVSVGNTHHGVFFQASNANIIFRRTFFGVVQATASANISYGSYQSLLAVRVNMKAGSPTVDSEIVFSQIMPGTLAALFADNSLLNALKFPVSGKASLSFEKGGALQQAGFVVDGGKGNIVSGRLAADIPVTGFHAEGQTSNNGNNVRINKLTADLNGMMLAGSGTVAFNNHDAAVNADATLKNIPAARVRMLWPPELSPQSRQWVIDNVKEGTISQASAHLHIPFGDLAKPALPRDDVDARIALDGIKIRYLPEHPEVSHVKGVIHVDGASLEADIASGSYMKNTRLTDGKLLIADLSADNPYITLSFNAESSAQDAVRLLGLPRLKHAAQLNLREDSASGTVQGRALLGFHFFTPKNADPDADITYDISARLTNTAAAGFMKKFDISQADGTLTIKNSGLEFKGRGNVNGATASAADIRYMFAPRDGFDTFVDVTATAPVTSLPRFGYPPFSFLKGTLGVKASFKQGKTTESSSAAIDLTHAAIAWTEFAWNKPDGEPASLDLAAEKKDGIVTIPSFHLKGRNMEAEGSAELDKPLSAIRRVTLARLKHGATDIDHLSYETIPGGWMLDVHGAGADISGLMVQDKNTPGTFSFEHFPAVTLKADIGQLILGKDRRLAGIKAMLNCDVQRCASANISGETSDGKPFSFRIMRNPKKQRQLSLHAESAGAFLKAAGVFEGMQGGDLVVIGNYDDAGQQSILNGALDINEHVVKDAPILAKILSLASLTGFFDTLQGNGIRFTRLHIPFTLTKDVITLKDAKTHGDAIGMTADGTITFPERTLDIQGTIVPSYTLNNLIGHVPLVGHLLTGGEGQGIFAARYSVRGSQNNPDVTVNPLSMLTPGFLRGVFDIFDMPPEKEHNTP
ncbi:MAG: AsmA-like C-terminal domain-containing protein [Pseudomonadota bacterium]|nr:AsmA-like C-terminal domain-containing protein [Pseudomonadota bacterium]MDE3037589.1 AsmA-like C-terminal domain-containing protein [Pseudomonadota bacterium]